MRLETIFCVAEPKNASIAFPWHGQIADIFLYNN